jgi:hypothetical protein
MCLALVLTISINKDPITNYLNGGISVAIEFKEAPLTWKLLLIIIDIAWSWGLRKHYRFCKNITMQMKKSKLKF